MKLPRKKKKKQFAVIKQGKSTEGKWDIITDTQLGTSQPSELSTHHYYSALFISHLPLQQHTNRLTNTDAHAFVPSGGAGCSAAKWLAGINQEGWDLPTS